MTEDKRPSIGITMMPRGWVADDDRELEDAIIYTNRHSAQRLRDLLIATRINAHLTAEAREDADEWANALEGLV